MSCATLGPFSGRPFDTRTVDLGDGVAMELVWIPEGEFMMGSEDGRSNERPVHRVRITQGFWMGRHEVTQAQWQAVMGTNPSSFQGMDHPVENVSWNDSQEFMGRLSEIVGYEFRLPTEAEWEYACRAGTETAYYFGDAPDRLDRFAWYRDNSGNSTQPVGEKRANIWGLHDMHGNVWEWCLDWYDEEFYARSPVEDPVNTTPGSFRVVRGGSWDDGDWNCRSTHRVWSAPTYFDRSLGFRVVSVTLP